jgi:SAM-dependent methyltransferase
MSWSDGYVTDVEYTQGYYRELSPAIIDLALLSKGLARPAHGTVRYLELGFGQGLSLNIHAAAHEGEFWGTDFASQQTVNARDLARAGGTGVRFENDGFTEFVRRTDLPEFDIIGIHGIYSWISDENRRAILDIIGARLAPGGVVYVSYNCPPGWAPAAPLQHLLSLYGQANAGQDLRTRIQGALGFAQQIGDVGSRYFAINPQIAERLKDLQKKDWRYVAHEYFNAHWHPMPFRAVAEEMASVRCDFAASAHILDHMEGANMSPAGRQLLAAQTGTVMRETVRDYLTNQQFRRDIYIKGGRVMKGAERNRRFAELAVIPLARAPDVKLETTTALGKVQLRPDIYQPVIDVIWGQGYRPASLRDLVHEPKLSRYSVDQIVEVTMTLIGTGVLAPVQTPSDGARQRCRSLNDAIRTRSLTTEDHIFLASPVVGQGVAVNRVYQTLMSAERAGRTTDGEMVDWAFNAFKGDEPFRPAPRDPAKDAEMRESLATDLKNYREYAPLYQALELI